MFSSHVLLVAALLSGAGAQSVPQATPPPQPAAQQAVDVDDDSTFVPAEPEFAVVNLPTTLRLPKWASSFRLTHRFLDNLRVPGFSNHLDNLFGLDNGAVIGLEYRIAPVRHVQFVFFRNNVDKTIQLSGRFDVIRQRGRMPVSASPIVSVEGTRNLRGGHSDDEGDEHEHGDAGGQRSGSVGVVLSRTFGDTLALYATPMWVHHTSPAGTPHQGTTFIGLAARARIRSKVYLVAEVSPRLGGYAPGDVEFAFGIERRAGGHMFQLNFTNATASTFGQLARGGFPNTLYLGFNLTRKFF